MKGIRSYTQKAKSGTRILGEDLLSRVGQRKTVKPRVLNLLVNDICNAECQMCNIWKQMPERVVSPDELREILEDNLFTELNYVGVSGGEPTLRSDLPELYEAIATARPDVSTGIITNGLVPDVVIDRVEKSGYVCADHGVDFGVMVSLDGVGEVHDRVRGTEGAFENSVSVLRYFRDETPFSVSVGCTVTKDNVWGVHELLEFCKQEDVNYKFRVAEFIDRLYNDDRNDKIRNFTPRELYHLGLFFAKLEDETRLHATKRRTYRNIRKMLMEGADRSIACYQQTHGATLDSAGNLMYCAPKSPKLGNTLERSAEELYYNNTDIRDQIEEDHCADCIHDYPSPQ
jgi:MoaA/NifB/PqqE/SkfB family radical SAM enzyme